MYLLYFDHNDDSGIVSVISYVYLFFFLNQRTF